MSLRSTMEAAGNYRAHYDAACKEILGCKQILANIMGEVLEEFRGLSPEEIERLIEPDSMRTGEPVGRNRPRIQGMRNEDSTILEGTIYYDILFRARCPGEAGREVGLRINVEAQNDYNPGYHISTRRCFTVPGSCRRSRQTCLWGWTMASWRRCTRFGSVWGSGFRGKSSLRSRCTRRKSVI